MADADALGARRLLGGASMRGAALADLAERLGWSRETFGRRLSALRRSGAGEVVHVYHPEAAGLPLQRMTDVRLRAHDAATAAAFEAWCHTEPAIKHAWAVAGRWDYHLCSYHDGPQAADVWSRRLTERAEVLACAGRDVRVLFGHGLAGAPVFTRAPRLAPVGGAGHL